MKKAVLSVVVSSLMFVGAGAAHADAPRSVFDPAVVKSTGNAWALPTAQGEAPFQVAQVTAPSPAATSTPAPADTASPPAGTNPFSAPATDEVTTGQEEARITAVTVEGNKSVPVNEILSQVNSKIGDPLSQRQVSRDVQAIYDLGYFTDVKVETEAEPGGVKIIYRVFENPVVKSIQISGNSIVPTATLMGMMQTREGQILNTKTLYADVSVINRYYDNQLGYLLEPTHITDLKLQPDGTLAMHVTEGMTVKGVVVEGSTVFPQSQIMPLVKEKPGDLFNQDVVKGDTARIAKLYEDNDYMLDTIRPGIDKETGIVHYHVLEATVERIRVEGNTKTHEDVVLRNIRTRPGEVLRKKKLQKDLERLNNLGFFESVKFEPEPGSAPGKVVLVAKVKEAKTGLATLGLGYSGGGVGALQAGITGSISFAEKNLGGRGQSASAQWQRGVNIDSLGLNYYDPAINARQDSFGFSVFSQTLNQLEQPVAGAALGTVNGFAFYDDHDVGASVTFGRLLTDDFRAFVTFKKESISITQDAFSQFTPIGLGSGDINSVALAGLYDTRDDIFNPHSGAYLNAGVVGAGGPLGGNFDYTKIQAEWRKYVPLKKNRTLAMRFWGGAIAGNAPVTEFFFLGGIDTLRGYQDNSLLGTSFILGNVEYRFPLAKLKILSGAVFAEAGNAYGGNALTGGVGFVNNNLNTNGLLMDAGFGLRLVYPTLGLGVIRLDYAVGQNGGRSSVGIGQSF